MVLGVALTLQSALSAVRLGCHNVSLCAYVFACVWSREREAVYVCVCVCAQTMLTQWDAGCAAHPSKLIQCQQNQGLLEYR